MPTVSAEPHTHTRRDLHHRAERPLTTVLAHANAFRHLTLHLQPNRRGRIYRGHSGLSLLHRGEHAFTEIQALPLPHAPVEGISKLAHQNGELAEVITELFHGILVGSKTPGRAIPRTPGVPKVCRHGCCLCR
jgi:hypothetical protein